MRAGGPLFFAFLTLFLLDWGCTREEEASPPVQKSKVVRPIQRPVREEAETLSPPEALEPQPAEKETTEAKTAAVEERASKEPEKEQGAEEPQVKEEPGYYVVKAGDTLASIAGSEQVYGDPLNWPILCRLNMDKLAEMEVGEDFTDRHLPEGTRLKIVTPDEARGNLEKRAAMPWVVNVLSSPNKGEIIPATIRLVKAGYPVYITRKDLKGKVYMRLRVGFFRDKTEAHKKGKEIGALLKLSDSWIIKVKKEEFELYGGY